jgi:hypothetical protein
VAVAPVASVTTREARSARTSPDTGAAAELHASLRSLAAAQGPLRRALAALAGRFVARRAWERLGFARAGDYARERLGLSARQLQDLATVDGALRELPAIESALVTGALSWTQARLLARVATPETERAWLERARELTATALAHAVRRVDTGSFEGGGLSDVAGDDAETWPRETVAIRCTPEVRARWWHVRQLANRVAGAALPPADCAEAVAAEVLSALPTALPDAERPLRWEAEPGPPGAALRRQRRVRRLAGEGEPEGPDAAIRAALPLALRGLLANLADADAFALDRRLRRAVALEQRLESRLGPLLRAVAEARLHERLGFPRFDAYVRAHLGLAPRRAQALVRLERVGDRVPALRAAYRAGRLSWVKAHALLPVLLLDVSAGVGAAWVRWAAGVTLRRLDADVERALALRAADPAAWEATAGLPDEACPDAAAAKGARSQIRAHSTRPEESARLFFTASRPVARLVRAVLCSVRRRRGPLTTEGEAFGWMLDHAIAVWSLDASGARARRAHRVFARDGWRCTVPGCSSYRNLHDHHVVFRSAGGSNDLANRTTLCAAHHLRGVHAGVVRCTGEAPAGLRFELGVRPDRPPLLRFDPGERLRVDCPA